MSVLTRYVLAVCALVLCGCTTFVPTRSSRFINDNGDVVAVEYARGEEYTTKFVTPNGVEMPYKSKLRVRVTLPDGERFIAYRHMSLSGVLYKTADEDWQFYEEGTACVVAKIAEDRKGYLLYFQGVMCMNQNMKEPGSKKPSITGSSTPRGFGRPSSGPRDSDGPRTVEQK